jgi:MoxR-like ATPase
MTTDPARLHAVGGPEDVRGDLEDALFEIKRVIVGQEAMLERVLVALLAGGHVLLEGVPGLAKTLTVKTVADVLGGTFNRIQFTPDLVPSDLVGTRVLRGGADSRGFDTELGPVFCNFLLADEINRAPAKVQSALLEVMQERQVTIGHTTHPVPKPFLVLATQNPIESEGTYPLPEAQVDRFMFKLVVDYPTDREESAVVARSLGDPVDIEPKLSLLDLETHQRAAKEVYVDRQVVDYAVALVGATRRPSPYVEFGSSPRGSINLVHAGRALAMLRGRSYALPVDVRDLARDVLRHRIVLTYEALADGVTAEQVLDEVLADVEMPHIELSRAEGGR